MAVHLPCQLIANLASARPAVSGLFNPVMLSGLIGNAYHGRERYLEGWTLPDDGLVRRPSHGKKRLICDTRDVQHTCGRHPEFSINGVFSHSLFLAFAVFSAIEFL
jgi:hypothetical protein